MTRAPLDRRALIGLVALLVGVVLMLGSTSGTLHGLFTHQSTHEVQAIFPSTQQLRKGDVVRIDGVRSGRVSDIRPGQGARTAKVTMEVLDDAGHLYRDARAVLRWKTVLGGAFYVDLERGTPNTGPLRGAIPVQRTARQVEVDDITSVLEPRARRGLQTLPGELAKGLADRDAPARLLATVATVAPDVRDGVGALRGMDTGRDLRTLVVSAERTVRALDEPRRGMERLVSGAAATLATVGGRDAEVRRSIAAAPATMAQADATLQRLRATLDLADPLLQRLRDPAGDVAPTLARLRPALTGADRLLRRAEPLLASLRPAAASLGRTAKSTLPLLEDLTPSVGRLDRTILPMLSEKDPGTTKSTAVMIGGTTEALGPGAGGQMDLNGHFIRFPATIGSSPLYSLPCKLLLNDPDAAEQIACSSLQEALATYMSYKPLGPTPGTEPPGEPRKKGTR
ncbi:MAG: hypothetical protein JWO02_3292 [Solirubrobacterales bacterium]|nr:hypothetical protein [Solirubrobacterales bacterium]